MTAARSTSPLFRLLRPDAGAGAADKHSGNTALRLALARAGRQCLGCDMMATEIARDQYDAPVELIDPLGEYSLVGRLVSGDDAGLVAADHGAVSAITSIRTTRGLPGEAPQRGATHVEAALAQPVLNRVLEAWAMAAEAGGDNVLTLIDGYRAAGRVASLRGLLMSLPVKALAIYRIGIEFDGVAKGTLVFGFPILRAGPDDAAAQDARSKSDPQAWSRQFAAECKMAPTGLNAVLYRHKMSLSDLRALRPGQVLPVPASALGDVRLVGAAGAIVGTARLGQLNGARAVRFLGPGLENGAHDADKMADLAELPDNAGPLEQEGQGARDQRSDQTVQDSGEPAEVAPTSTTGN